MSRNLEEKLSILLDDISTLSKESALKKLKKFVEEEISFTEETHSVTKRDLYSINSTAKNEISTINTKPFQSAYGTDSDSLRTWCYLDSVVMFLRSKGLINFTINFKPKED